MKDHDNEQQPITGERQPTELRGLRPITIGSFCSGYGGLEIGVSRALGGNTRTVFMVERETFAVANMANKIQEKRMDSALIYNDVRTFPYRKYRGCIDVAVAGIPCQPHSSAGKRKGGGDERFLFDDWLDGISEMRPSYVLIENVEGLCSSKMPDGTLCLGYVFRRLEDVGYQVERADKTLSFGTFSAAEVGAPHLRKRVFILAKLADGESIERQRTLTIGDRCERPEETVGGSGSYVADGDVEGLEGRELNRTTIESEPIEADARTTSRTRYPSRPGERQYEWEEPRVVGGELGDASSIGSHRGSEDCTDVEPEVLGTRHESYVADESSERRRGRTNNDGGDGQRVPEQAGEERSILRSEATGCGGDEEADPSEAQSELGGTVDARKRRRGVDAITNRVDRLRLLGNGVVPDCAELAFRTLFNRLAYDCTRDTDNNQ